MSSVPVEIESYVYDQTRVPTTFTTRGSVPTYLKQDQPKNNHRRLVVSQDALRNIDFRLTAVELLDVLANKRTSSRKPTPRRRRKKKKTKTKSRKKKQKRNAAGTSSSLQHSQLKQISQNHQHLLQPNPSKKEKVWSSLNIAKKYHRTNPTNNASMHEQTKDQCNVLDVMTNNHHRELLNNNNNPPKITNPQKNRSHSRIEEKIKKARREAQPWMFNTTTATKSVAQKPTPPSSSPEPALPTQPIHPALPTPPTQPTQPTQPTPPSQVFTRNSSCVATSQPTTLGTVLRYTAVHPPGKKKRCNFIRENKINAVHSKTEQKRSNRLKQRNQHRKITYKRASELRITAKLRAETFMQQREQRTKLRLFGDEARTRSRAWLKLIVLTSTFQVLKKAWHTEQTARSDENIKKSAASVIVGAWGRKNASKRGQVFRGAYVTVQRACFKLIMRRRTTIKRRASSRIMNFMLGIASQRFRGVMLHYRTCVIKAQRYWRSFRACKHARILALHYIWDEVEVELRIIEKRYRSRRLRKILKTLSETSPWLNAAVRRDRVGLRRKRTEHKDRSMCNSDISGTIIEGEKIDGVQFVVGDRAAALLDQHLRDGLKMIMKRNEFKAAMIEVVPFDIRFELCHVLLTELRRKHAQELINTKQINERIQRRNSTRGTFSLSSKQNNISSTTHSPSFKTSAVNPPNPMGPSTETSSTDPLLHANDPDQVIPNPPFVVYSSLGETTLLTIVNAGRQIFDSRKKEGLKHTCKFSPLYRPAEEYNGKKTNEKDDMDELVQDQLDYRRLQAANNRKDNNTKERTHRKALQRQQETQLRKSIKNYKKTRNKHEVGIIVTVPRMKGRRTSSHTAMR